MISSLKLPFGCYIVRRRDRSRDEDLTRGFMISAKSYIGQWVYGDVTTIVIGVGDSDHAPVPFALAEARRR